MAIQNTVTPDNLSSDFDLGTLVAQKIKVLRAQELSDLDGDTLVQVERSADDDRIFFYVAGGERGRFWTNGLDVKNDSGTVNLRLYAGGGNGDARIQFNADGGPADIRFTHNDTSGDFHFFSENPQEWMFFSDSGVVFRIHDDGTLSMPEYGQGAKEAADLGATPAGYSAEFATDGTLLERRRMQAGQLTGQDTGNNGTVVSTGNADSLTRNLTEHVVSFPNTFEGVPIVTVSLQGNNVANGHGSIINAWVKDGTVTTSGFTVIVSDSDGSGNVVINWQAILP